MKIYRSRKIFACYLLAGVALICACKKEETKFDVTGDKFNRVFLRSANLKFDIVNTPVGTIGKISAAIPVFATMQAHTELKVNITVDNSLIEAFNTKNQTQYKPIPDGLVNLTSAVNIAAGQQVSSDSLKVVIPSDKLQQLTEKSYLLPLRISTVSGDPNVETSSNQNTVYLIVNTSYSFLYDAPKAVDMVGSIISNRSKWIASCNKTILYGEIANIFDGSELTSFYLNSEPLTFTVDLGETINGIQGIRLKSLFDFYGITTVNFSSSTDGVIWKDYGTANLAQSIGAQYIRTYGAINARYLRLNITGWQNTLIILSEFDLYK